MSKLSNFDYWLFSTFVKICFSNLEFWWSKACIVFLGDVILFISLAYFSHWLWFGLQKDLLRIKKNIYIYILEIQPPYGGLLSSSCGGLGPFGPNSVKQYSVQLNNRCEDNLVTLPDGRTDRRTTGLRELDNFFYEYISFVMNLSNRSTMTPKFQSDVPEGWILKSNFLWHKLIFTCDQNWSKHSEKLKILMMGPIMSTNIDISGQHFFCNLFLE